MFSLGRTTLVAALLSVALTIISTAATADGQSILIPVSTCQDMVFDYSGQHLYISTSDGFVRRYNVATAQLETSYNLGGSLWGIDIAHDNSFLLVAQGAVTGSQGTIHRITLSNGAVTDIHYTRLFGGLSGDEQGAWDVAIGSNGLALFTTQGDGHTPVRQINLTTNAVTSRTDTPGSTAGSLVTSFTQIERSADERRFFFLEWWNGPRHLFTYNAATNTFGSSATEHTEFKAGAVNRDGALVCTVFYGGAIYFGGGASLDTAPSFSYRHSFGGATSGPTTSGITFDANADTLYLVAPATKRIVAYDTNTYAEKFELDIGLDEFESVDYQHFGEGTLVASPDGIHLALETSSGVRLIDVTAGTVPPPPAFGTPRDMVFDHAGQYLYVTTKEGLVWPYSLSTRTFGIPYDLGGYLNALDIATDDSCLVVAQGNIGLLEGMFQKVNLADGAVTNINYTRDHFGEAGAWDVAIAPNGLAFGATAFSGSGDTPLHEINLTTNSVSNRTDAPGSGPQGNVSAPAGVHRSADASRLYILEDLSTIQAFTYSAITNTFGSVEESGSESQSSQSSAVNRNGTLLAGFNNSNGVSLKTAPDFVFLHRFNALNSSGTVFDAVHDTLYGINSAGNVIIAYDTNTFAEKFRFNIGENLEFDARFNKLVASPDGHYLALMQSTHFLVFAVPPVPLVSVASIKSQGSSTFGIDLPLDGTTGVECRSGGPTGAYTLVVTFSTPVSFDNASVTSGIGMVTGTGGTGTTAATITLTNVANAQIIKVNLPNVSDGNSTTNLIVPMSILIGDTTGNGTVSSSDVMQVKFQSGQPITISNFREDVNGNGVINASDVTLVKSRVGTALSTGSQAHSDRNR